MNEQSTCRIRDNERGGGTIILMSSRMNNNLITKASSTKPIAKDSILAKYIFASNRILWLGSIYLHKGTVDEIIELFSDIQRNVPEEDWPNVLLAGDWNVDVFCGLDADDDGKRKRFTALYNVKQDHKVQLIFKRKLQLKFLILKVILLSEVKFINLQVRTITLLTL